MLTKINFAILQFYKFIVAEPRCPQGQPYKDNNGKAVTCSSSRSKSTCPANYECYFDGYMFGCCPNKGMRLKRQVF